MAWAGGFAAYGIYPDYKDCFALHLFSTTMTAVPNVSAI